MSFLPQHTQYQLPNGGFTMSYEHFKDAKAEHAAAQAQFDSRFGQMLSTPEGRRGAIDGMRAGALEKSRTVHIAPAAPKYQGGLTEAEVERRIDVASTGTVNRHGGVDFAIPEASKPQAASSYTPPGYVRTNFFSGAPEA